ncbi:MAG: cupin domain-containing protein [Kiritimatiellia bacterium]|jgi:quercetin dioxygenase-like cupin family protein|nr:cupin domain-containing protein [Kiritimatiellia bacterium]
MSEDRSMTAEEIQSRVARFDGLQPMSTSKDLDWVPQDAIDIIFARDLRPIIIENTKNPFGETAAIYGAGGTTMNVSIMPPGQGPCLHSHDATYETFFVLEGTIEFRVGPNGEEVVTLNKWDTFSCPPKVYRGFRNVGDTDAVLLTTITGPVDARDDVGVPPSVGEEVQSRFGDEVLDEFKKIATFRES